LFTLHSPQTINPRPKKPPKTKLPTAPTKKLKNKKHWTTDNPHTGPKEQPTHTLALQHSISKPQSILILKQNKNE